MTKEEIFDEQIDPLMRQIITICEKHRISNICSFALDDDEDSELICTTTLIKEDCNPPEYYKDIMQILFPPEFNGIPYRLETYYPDFTGEQIK